MADSAPTVVVGVDGSKAATDAARWAVDEAVSRDIPLRLVYVVAPPDSQPRWVHDGRLAAARAVLHDARRAVEATGEQVKIEGEILWGSPLVKLMEESRSAAMICVGSIGLNHAARGVGSLSANLAASALCPVAVIRRPAGRPATAELGRVIVPADNAILAGAGGYVVKDVKGMELSCAIKDVAAGRSLLDTQAAAATMARLWWIIENSDELSAFDDRERTLLGLLGDGLTNRQIADRTLLGEDVV
ncbi:universal stress protein [Mycobacterium sp. 1081908.1]|uniref:universal stress protein n=1 Tax=Mycobacterium sp. 1081908.1 TaxID=1834066 RepID=UPI000800F120|nr:hypothetical protein A5655_14900 [Mycobacterium sp. 1081908.1]